MPGSRRRILILGVGSLAQGLSQVLLSRSKMFTDLVGLIAQDNAQVGDELVGTKVVGTMNQLLSVVERAHFIHRGLFRGPAHGVACSSVT